MNRTRPLRLPFASLLIASGLFSCACGASVARESTESSAAAPAEEAAPGDGSNADLAGEQSGRAEKKSEAPAPPRAPSAAEGRSDSEADEGAVSESEPTASKITAPTEKGELLQTLHAEIERLSSSLKPGQLSCAGAKPHQDAICSIAARICEMEQPSTTKSSDCQKAEQSCKTARERYEDECD